MTDEGTNTPPEPDPEPAPVVPLSEYDPRADFGPERHEDENLEPSEWGEEPLDLEEQRKDDTTLLATDRVSVDEENNLVITPLEKK